MTRAAMQARITELEQMVKTLSETITVLLRTTPSQPFVFTAPPAQPTIYPQPPFPPYTPWCGDPISIGGIGGIGGITTCGDGIKM